MMEIYKSVLLLGLVVLGGLAFAYLITDTDGGNQPARPGTCTEVGNARYADHCGANNTLTEYFGQNGFCTQQVYYCPSHAGWTCKTDANNQGYCG